MTDKTFEPDDDKAKQAVDEIDAAKLNNFSSSFDFLQNRNYTTDEFIYRWKALEQVSLVMIGFFASPALPATFDLTVGVEGQRDVDRQEVRINTAQKEIDVNILIPRNKHLEIRMNSALAVGANALKIIFYYVKRRRET